MPNSRKGGDGPASAKPIEGPPIVRTKVAGADLGRELHWVCTPGLEGNGREVAKRGFEINVHDLNHDGHLVRERKEFLRRAQRINFYGRQSCTLGFRAALMHRNVDWFDALEFSYDISVPNMARLDAQQDGCCTVFPLLIGKMLKLPAEQRKMTRFLTLSINAL